MQNDPDLPLFAGASSTLPSRHPLLKNYHGYRYVDMNSSPRKITVTNRGGTSQGIDIWLEGLNIKPDSSYEFSVTGKVITGTGNHNMFIQAVSGSDPVDKGTNVGNPFVSSTSATNAVFTLTFTRTYIDITSDMAAGITRYRIGGASAKNLEITGIVISETSKEPFDIPVSEVKFLLNPDLTLDANGNLLSGVASLFGGLGRDRGRIVTMQYMDTPDRTFNSDGLINRIRYRNWNQPGEGYQITYRKRIPITWPVCYETIQAAVASANAQGFGNWTKGIDWSYNSAVLTLDREVSTGGSVSGTLPNIADSRELLKSKIPGDVASLYGSALTGDFDSVIAYGPVTFRRYEFNFPGTSQRVLRIEVMPIKTADGNGTEYIAEASFEFEDSLTLEQLAERRTQIQTILQNAGILVRESGLRTSKVLERYGEYPESVIYNAQSDPSLPLFAGAGNSELPSLHPLLRSHDGFRTVNMSSVPKTITITNRGGTSQGVDIWLEGLNVQQDRSYKFQVTGRVLTGTGSHDMFIRAVSGNSPGAGTNVGNPLINVSSATNAVFKLSLTRTYGEITADIAAGINRYRIGGASARNLEITGIVISEISPATVDFITIKGVQYSTGLITLNLSGKGLTNADIQPLKYMTNLTSLYMDTNRISNLMPLSGLTKLRTLEVYRNQISNVAPLSGLTNLTRLSLQSNGFISDITPLSGLSNLTWLNLGGNGIRDLAPLSGLTNLQTLYLWDNIISNTSLASLSGLTNLTYLNLHTNQISNVSALIGLPSLTQLILGKTQITDSSLSALSGMTKLTFLSLYDNQISDLTPLSGLTNLTRLDLENNQISDLTPLSGLTNLQTLYLQDNQISNVIPLTGLMNLRNLYLLGNPIDSQVIALLRIILSDCSIPF
jgi:Leucine-rich repeat (LRR) protein